MCGLLPRRDAIVAPLGHREWRVPLVDLRELPERLKADPPRRIDASVVERGGTNEILKIRSRHAFRIDRERDSAYFCPL